MAVLTLKPSEDALEYFNEARGRTLRRTFPGVYFCCWGNPLVYGFNGKPTGNHSCLPYAVFFYIFFVWGADSNFETGPCANGLDL